MNGIRFMQRLLFVSLLLLLLSGCVDSVRSVFLAQHGDTFYVDKDYPSALVKFQEAADLNNGYACYRLYVMHQYGQGTAKDKDAATRMLEKAARLGDETSQVILGSRLLFGDASKRPEGVRLLEDAAAKENRYAYEYLSLAYQHGLGVKQNAQRANEYRSLAISQGGKPGPAVVGKLGTAASGKSGTDSEKLELTRSIQRELKELGYYRGKLDGLYGPMTRDAIARFQKDRGHPVEPVITEQVLKQLKKK